MHRYFTDHFPRLVLTCWCFARAHCGEEPGLARFLPSAAAAFPFSTDSLARRLAAGMRAGAAPQAPQRLDVRSRLLD